MADLEENLRTYLLSDATFKALVETRFYVNELPQLPQVNQKPEYQYDFVILQQAGSTDDDVLDEGPAAPNRVQYILEAVSLSQSRMRAIINRAQELLNRKKGDIGDQTVKGIFAQTVSDENEHRNISDASSYKRGALSLEVVT